jgi:hypothetical protein
MWDDDKCRAWLETHLTRTPEGKWRWETGVDRGEQESVMIVKMYTYFGLSPTDVGTTAFMWAIVKHIGELERRVDDLFNGMDTGYLK